MWTIVGFLDWFKLFLFSTNTLLHPVSLMLRRIYWYWKYNKEPQSLCGLWFRLLNRSDKPGSVYFCTIRILFRKIKNDFDRGEGVCQVIKQFFSDANSSWPSNNKKAPPFDVKNQTISVLISRLMLWALIEITNKNLNYVTLIFQMFDLHKMVQLIVSFK